MIIGRVTERDEASVPLTLLDDSGQQVEVEAVVDTGFTGYLALSDDVVQRFQFPRVDEEEVDLADGSTYWQPTPLQVVLSSA